MKENKTPKIVLVAFSNSLMVPMTEEQYKDYLKNRDFRDERN